MTRLAHPPIEMAGAGLACIAVLAALAIIGVPIAVAQTDPARPQRMAKDADPDWEVVSVRPSDPDGQVQDIRTQGRHMLIHRQTVEAMLMAGYGLQKSQIAGAADWVKTESFDVDGLADMEGEPSVQQFQSLIRKLLAERFGLKAHKEQREMSVFVLTIAKDGPKLTPAKGDRYAGGQQMARGGEGYRTLSFKDTSMEDFALLLIQYVDRPIVNQTAVKGSYDFTLKYTYDESRAPTDGTAPPNLFTAVQEQLGLKLIPTKAPADVLVIDHVDKPSPN